MRSNWKVWSLAALAVAALAGRAEQKEAPPPAVTVDRVTVLSHTEPKRYVGVTRAIEEVTIPARVSGRIEEIHFEKGGMVNQGDLLFVLEDTTYQADVLTAKAVLAQSEAEFKYAESEFERKSGLYAKQAVSQTELENATRLVAFTKAKIDEGKAALIRAENQLSYTRIYAPITGRIGKFNYSVGNYVTPQTPEPLADIVQVDPINVAFAVSERDFLNSFMRENCDISALFQVITANQQKFEGAVAIDFIDNRVDKTTGTITVWLECANPDGLLVPDGFVTVTLADEFAEPQPAVSVTAVMTDRDSNYVYVVNDADVAERRDIVLGPMVDNLQIVKSGLQQGDLVVVDGGHKVMPGKKVVPVLVTPGAEGR